MGVNWSLSKEECDRRSARLKQHTTDDAIQINGECATIAIGEYSVLLDANDLESVRQHKWWYDHGYAATRIRGQKLYMHRLIMGNPTGNIDHINGEGLDNRQVNLRVCNQTQNSANSKLSKANKTGYKGVFWRANRNKFRASIRVNQKQLHLGHYVTALEAAKAYDAAALKHFGEFARLNTKEV